MSSSNRWKKVDGVLQFTISRVDIKKGQSGSFVASWSRGDHKGQTDAVAPSGDSGTVLAFGASFECPVTLYQSKVDGRIKEKELQVSLYRYADPKHKKLFSKLHCNVAKAFGLAAGLEISSEMETGHSVAPVIEMTINLYVEDEENEAAGQDDENEADLLNPGNKNVGLDDWDMTETGESDSDSDEKPPKATNESKEADEDVSHNKHEETKKEAKEEAKEETKEEIREEFKDKTNEGINEEIKEENNEENKEGIREETNEGIDEIGDFKEEIIEDVNYEVEINEEGNNDVTTKFVTPPISPRGSDGESFTQMSPPPSPPPPRNFEAEQEAAEEAKLAEKRMFERKEASRLAEERIIEGKRKAELDRIEKEIQFNTNSTSTSTIDKQEKKEEQNSLIEQQRKEEDQEKNTVNEDFLQEINKEPESSDEFIQLALCTTWPLPSLISEEEEESRFMLHTNPHLSFTAAVFPAVCCIIESSVLASQTSESEFFKLSKQFSALFEDAFTELSSSEKLLTVFAMQASLMSSANRLCLNKQRIKIFFTNPIEKAVSRLLKKRLSKSEVLTNRLATAKFDFQSLLTDFVSFLTKIRGSFKFTSEINEALFSVFLENFEVRIVNKILSNPKRFTFTNAMMWNTLVSAVESDAKINFKILKQIVSVLIMAPNLTKDATLMKEICPNIDKNFVAFVLLNYQTDEVLSDPLNPLEFFNAAKITELLKEARIEPGRMISFAKILNFDNSKNWQKAADERSLLVSFPFFRKFYVK